METYDPTIEDSYRKQVQIDNSPCVLEVLDTAGQEEYLTLRDQWLRDGEGFLVVYSIALRSTFENVRTFVSQINRVKQELAVKNAPIMIVGNKADMSQRREVSTSEGEALAKSLGCTFLECSAKTGINVEGAFFGLVGCMRQRRGEAIQSPKSLSPANSFPLESGKQDQRHASPSIREKLEKRKKCIVM